MREIYKNKKWEKFTKIVKWEKFTKIKSERNLQKWKVREIYKNEKWEKIYKNEKWEKFTKKSLSSKQQILVCECLLV